MPRALRTSAWVVAHCLGGLAMCDCSSKHGGSGDGGRGGRERRRRLLGGPA